MSLTSLAGHLREELGRRVLPEGGLVDRLQGQFRVDATAWGILAFKAAGVEDTLLDKHRVRLLGEQSEDGRVGLSPHQPESYWPTALAALAWCGSRASQAAQSRAVHFLLGASGVHFPKKPDVSSEHDPSLKGWPWVEHTHSWIEPTANCIVALRASGYGEHDRVREAVQMILNRQLPHGGWNYGNVSVFGKELHPMPESTGAALVGVAGQVEQEMVARSLAYLEGEVDRLRTPVSLGWALLGLAAWKRWPQNGGALAERCVASEVRYGGYETSAFCVLSLGALAGEPETTIPLFVRSDHRPTSRVAAH